MLKAQEGIVKYSKIVLLALLFVYALSPVFYVTKAWAVDPPSNPEDFYQSGSADVEESGKVISEKISGFHYLFTYWIGIPVLALALTVAGIMFAFGVIKGDMFLKIMVGATIVAFSLNLIVIIFKAGS